MRSTWLAVGGAASLVVHALPSVTVLAALAGHGPDRVGPVRLRAARRDDAVALTFDDGPSGDTPRLLALLETLGLRATFFVTGRATNERPGVIAEIQARGHEVETHGMEHRHHLLHTPGWVRDDLTRALDVLGPLGVTPRYLRPPFGQTSTASLFAAREHRLETVLWSAWGREWDDHEPSSVAARVRRGLRPGAVVLLHDSDVHCGAGSVATVEAALPVVAEELHRRGLAAVTLAELFA